MKTAIVGGGAAGFFLAINLKEMNPWMQVDIFERSHRVLAKVEVSGGGRCNCTNTFEGVSDLSQVYPRGHRLMRRLFHLFDHHDAYRWFERHGVPLSIQPDHCVFPAAQDSHAIIDCFLGEAHHHGIRIFTGHPIHGTNDLEGYDFVAVTTGGSPHAKGLEWLRQIGHTIEEPVPSLFSLSTDDTSLKAMMGTVCDQAIVSLPGTKMRGHGPLLITHWGLSGPAILRLSSYAARLLHDQRYTATVCVNWTGLPETDVRELLGEMAVAHPKQQAISHAAFGMTQRLWAYLISKSLAGKSAARWCELGKKDINRLVTTLTANPISITGRAPFRDEFVTCGGVSLSSIHLQSLESRVMPRYYFAGEVLDIDGITGGFNFQAAWTTAYTAAHAIAQEMSKLSKAKGAM